MAYHRSCSVEIRLCRAVGLELTVVPFSFSFVLVEPLAIFVVGFIYVVLAFLGSSFATVSASAIFAATIDCIRRGGVIGVRGFRTNPWVDVGSS